MRDRLDPLIAERAPWLFADRRTAKPARAALTRLLGYERTVALAEHFRDRSTAEIMATMGALLARDVKVRARPHPAPRGGADRGEPPDRHRRRHHPPPPDRALRPDLFFYANSDILRVLPQMEDMIAPVEWRLDKRTHAKTRETMAYTRRAMEAGGSA
jgi:hypothetical protein